VYMYDYMYLILLVCEVLPRLCEGGADLIEA
jgi:hypothetical protein